MQTAIRYCSRRTVTWEGENKIRKASKERSVFLAVNAVNAVNATGPRPLGVEQMLSRPSLTYLWMASGFLQNERRWHPTWRDLRPIRSMCFIDPSFHGTAGRMTRETGRGMVFERERVRLEISRTLMRDREIIQRSGDGSLLLYNTALSIFRGFGPAAPQSRRRRADGPSWTVRRLKPPTIHFQGECTKFCCQGL